MFSILGSRQPFCDAYSRRDVLRVGALAAGGLALPELLRRRALAGLGGKSPKAVIMICLPGGPTHHEMYDMKPDAPEEIRGEFKPVATNVPGLDVCELMPQHTRIADRLAIVRNMKFFQPDHQLHEVFTGYPTLQQRPAFGSIVSRVQSSQRSLLPKYMSLGYSDHPRTVAIAERPHYAGEQHAPFEPSGEGLKNLQLLDGLTLERFHRRHSLVEQFDQLRGKVEQHANLVAMDEFRSQALQMITSPQVREALDVSREPASVRELYGADHKFSNVYQFGHTWHGTNFLLARRLVEAGVPVVTVSEGGWDHHGAGPSLPGNLFERSREQLPVYDRSIYALVTDLHERGLDRDVAVVVWGEFGRTPKVNKNAGRDHWPPAGFALFFGGGFRTGQVIGATDSHGAYPTTRPYTPQNVFATLYRHLGINPAQVLYDAVGRPLMLLDDHEPIRELI